MKESLPWSSPDHVRKALPQDRPEIGSALGRAFFDDPLFAWAIPDENRRQRFNLEFFTLYAKAFLRHDQTYTTGGEVVAAALWAPPGAVPIGGEDAEELGASETGRSGCGVIAAGTRRRLRKLHDIPAVGAPGGAGAAATTLPLPQAALSREPTPRSEAIRPANPSSRG